MKKLLLVLIVLKFSGCAPQTQITTKMKVLSERWIEFDDIENIKKGMNYFDVLDTLGEPLFIEFMQDTTSITYNYATKLYDIPFGWKRYKMGKPNEKNRKPGAPYGDLYVVQLKFEKYKLFEIVVTSKKEFRLASDKTFEEEYIDAKFKWWIAIVPLFFLLFTI